MIERAYSVAGLHFMVDDSSNMTSGIMGQYAPFLTHQSDLIPFLFSIRMVSDDASLFPQKQHSEVVREEGDFLVRMCSYQDGQVYYEFHYHNKKSASILINRSNDDAKLRIDNYIMFGFNNAVRTLYGLSALKYQAVPFHASAICHQGKAYLFLGKSGTGKSTHSSLWLNHINGTDLINDDVPVVRMINGEFFVYGSPWSGKTPCYRNVCYPLGGVVRIHQAPQNKIKQLSHLEAYAAIIPSMHGEIRRSWVAENVHQIATHLIQKVRVWSLECLPDKDAARICCEAITKT